MFKSPRSSDLIGRPVERLPTPCLLVEWSALKRNIGALQRFLNRKGKSLRAHAKTHKSSWLAQLQLDEGAIGICAAKLSEAEKLIEKGITEILITGPIASAEVHERLQKCLKLAPQLLVVFDNLENARRLAAQLPPSESPLRCLIDLDPGFHRSGVPFSESVKFAEALREIPQLKIQGIQCYAGDLQHISSRDERATRNRQVLREAANIFYQFQASGLDMEIFSVGGTGTVEFDVEIPEVTEIQAGSYLFMDTEYAQIEWGDFLDRPGSFETSLSLLSTVVSANHAGFATIDAGLKAMYRDGPTPIVIDPPDQQLSYEWFGDEYGKVITTLGDYPFAVGQKVRLALSHVDPTVNLFDFFYVVDEGAVMSVLPVDLRGCSQ